MGYNINEVYQTNSDHLKSEDIGNGMPTFTITNVEPKDFDNGDRKLIASFLETDKTLVLNATNARAIGDLYTPDTDNWNGKQIMLFTMPVEFNGKQTMGIRVRAPATQNNQFQGNQSQQNNNNYGYSENPNPNG